MAVRYAGRVLFVIVDAAPNHVAAVYLLSDANANFRAGTRHAAKQVLAGDNSVPFQRRERLIQAVAVGWLRPRRFESPALVQQLGRDALDGFPHRCFRVNRVIAAAEVPIGGAVSLVIGKERDVLIDDAIGGIEALGDFVADEGTHAWH